MSRIVVVEDEVIVARSIAKVLALNGHDVPACVTTGDDAIAAARTLHPDLMLMDIQLRGGMNGIEAGTRIRQTADIPIVFLTAYADRAHLDRAKDAEPYGYLIKPYSDRELLTTVEIAVNRHNLERAAADREKWLATLLRSIGDGVIAVGLDLRVISLNGVAEGLTGWSDAEARGQPVSDVLHLIAEDSGERRDVPLRRVMTDRQTAGCEAATLLVARDGSKRAIEESVAAIVDNHERVSGGVIVFRDITHRRLLERRLAMSERMASLATLTAGVGHELNNPLAYNLGNLQLLAEQLPELRARAAALTGNAAVAIAHDLEEAAGLALDALSGAQRMKEVLTTLHEVSNQPELRPISLASCVEGALRFLGAELQRRSTVTTEIRAGAEVQGQESRLIQVFANILLNAAQSLPDAGAGGARIQVLVTQTDTRAVVEISDTGAGISGEVLPHIFEPFFTTRSVAGSTGLGLAIANIIIQQHGGEITVRSQPGAGTTFRVELPRIVSARPVVPAQARRRVLIVDDDVRLLRLFGRLLSKAFDVRTATGGDEALAHIASSPPDVVVCDLMMPGMTGIELHARVQASDPALASRFLFITGGAFTPGAQEFVIAMGERVLCKPIVPKDLIEAVARVPL